jgi:hypothetical protein
MLKHIDFQKAPVTPTYPVIVTHGDGMYTAGCEALSLVMEAKTFEEELTERVRELAPDMIQVNDFSINPTLTPSFYI